MKISGSRSWLTLVILAWCGRADAQGDVLFPGSTVQGDALRGEGVKLRGEAVFYLNAAKARSIDADALMLWNEYVHRSYQEQVRQRAARLAAKATKRNANLAEVERRLRENPSERDVAVGDALNVLLVDLSDPRISPSAWRLAKVPLPDGTAKQVPFQYSAAGGVFSLRRLAVGDAWPVALRYKALEPQRRQYERDVATLLDQCRRKRLAPEAVDAVAAAARALRSRAAEVVPKTSQEYLAQALRFSDGLERAARTLTRSDYVEDLLGELGDFRDATVEDLLDLMRRFNLHFGPAEAPDERRLYTTIYALLRRQREDLGLRASPTAVIAAAKGEACPNRDPKDRAARIEAARPFLESARALFDRGDGGKEKTIAEFNAAIQLDPDSAVAHYFRGCCFHTQGKFREAVADFNEVERIEPPGVWNFHMRGFTYAYLGEYAQAFRDMDAAIRMDPNVAAFFLRRSWAHLKVGNLAQAKEDRRKAVQLDPRAVEEDPILINRFKLPVARFPE